VARGDYGEYRWAVTQLFASVDPLRLLAAGAPDDEYEPEIDRLLRWRDRVDVADVYHVFEDQAISSVDASRLAAGIAEIRARFGYAKREGGD
jgi:hypothetical protein